MARTSGPWFWMRWAWRDLRQHWVAVLTISCVMAIGIGVYAGLGSTAAWRRESNDRSFAELDVHDLRLALSTGTFADAGALVTLVGGIPDAADVHASSERLVLDSQLEAEGADGSFLVFTRLVGMDLSAPVDGVWVAAGARPDPAATPAQGVLEVKFADDRGLADSGTVSVGGGEVVYTGVGTGPEEFFVTGPEGTIFAGGDVATLYLDTRAAGRLIGRPGAVNDVVLTLTPGADGDRIAAQLVDAAERSGLGATVTDRADIAAFRVLYEDIDNDQQFWNGLSALVLLAAALASFNLVNRIVEAQRREIGIGMAMGVPSPRLAIRPVLVGLQIAVLGCLLGVGFGLLVGAAMGDLLRSVLPLPVHLTPFQPGVFARGAVLGMAIPVLSSVLPVMRALRVQPVQAIRTGHLAAKTSRAFDWTNRLRLPGRTTSHMPIRNLLRTPRRTLLTATGVGAAITALVGTVGLLDSFTRAIDVGGAEMTRGDAGRVVVQLDTFYPLDSEPFSTISSSSAVARVDPGLRVPTSLGNPTGEHGTITALLELVDLQRAVWTPSIDRRVSDAGGRPAVILARKAADDLGVRPGDAVAITHPARAPDGSFTMDVTEFTVLGLHRNPIRTVAFADMSAADSFGLAGVGNMASVFPVAEATATDVQRAVFGVPGVTSSQSMARIQQVFDDALDQFVGVLFITAGAVLLLAVLIAFNATRITVEERRREHATMRAFGLPTRSVVAMIVKESVLVGLLATAVGIVAGGLFLRWMLSSLAARTLPDMGIAPYVSPTTMLLAAVVGVLGVALAPLFVARRIGRMNIPDTLRVME
jgi:putative ABC transport system permease protein